MKSFIEFKNNWSSGILWSISVLLIVWACSNDDGSIPPETQNNPPETFELIGVTNGAVGVSVNPAFSWQSATDPDGDSVSYDLYLDTDSDPSTLIAGDMNGTSFTVKDRLHLITEYHWKVVAKDGQGGQAESSVNSFKTRHLSIPDTPVNSNAAFSARSGHTSVVFNDKLWIAGGGAGFNDLRSDVWYSADGDTWTEATQVAGFSARWGHEMVVFNDKLWIIGGINTLGFMNDIWFSEDGVNWTEATPAAGFTERAYLTTAVFDNKLWVIGGFDTTSCYLNDVWFSTDGTSWSQANPSADFSERIVHSTVVYDNKLWVLGGQDSNEFKNDIWASADGINWKEAPPESNFSERAGHTSLVFKNKIWVMGGEDGSNYKNDVWAMD